MLLYIYRLKCSCIYMLKCSCIYTGLNAQKAISGTGLDGIGMEISERTSAMSGANNNS